MAKKSLIIDPPKVRRTRPQPVLVRGILGKTLERYHLDKDLARYQFVLHWKKIVGEDIASRATPECLRGGTLVVRVSSSAWAQELSFQKQVILHRLKSFLGDDKIVRDIMFYVAPTSAGVGPKAP